jgi:hypothetical protein
MSLTNTFAFIIGILPLLLLVGVMKQIKPKGNLLWVYGIMFILISAFLLHYLNNDLPLTLDALFNAEALAESELEKNKKELEVWVYLGPAVIAAIGANFITEYLIKE